MSPGTWVKQICQGLTVVSIRIDFGEEEMQISDLYGQYSRNTGQPVNAANVVQADKVGTLSSTVSKLAVGSIFEGNVTKLSGGNVLLSLSNGQSLSARMDNSIKLMLGESMFFQVKSNDGKTVFIKPYTGGNLANPIIKSALETAGLPINDRTTDMVNAMMKEHMPVNADALGEMYKAIASMDSISVDTAVTMTKLGLPITPENASQFENYVNDSGEMLKQMESFFGELPEFLSSEEFSAPIAIGVNHELLSIITDGMEDTVVIMPDEAPGVSHALIDQEGGMNTDEFARFTPETEIETTGAAATASRSEFVEMAPLSDAGFESLEAPDELPSLDTIIPVSDNIIEFGAEQTEGFVTASPAKALQETTILPSLEPGFETAELYEKNQVGSIFKDDESLLRLSENLRNIGDLEYNEMLFDRDGSLNKNITAKQLLSIVDTELLRKAAQTDKEDLNNLLGSREYRDLLQNVMEEQWMLKPSDVRDKDSVKGLYEKLDKQLAQIEKLTNLTGQDTSALTQTAGQIRDNMSFISDLNQMYTYTQIPLKMSGQNASGDLYVYTNKKALRDPEGELSAFLHLDMDNLGSTDVSVRMLKKRVTTDFFLKDDKSFALIQEHMGELKAKLEAMGFDATITVTNEEKPVSFVKDFLEKDMPKAKDMVHRYSFDVRA